MPQADYLPHSDDAERERQEAIAGIRRGLAEAEAGKGRPVREVFEAIRKKYHIPRSF